MCLLTYFPPNVAPDIQGLRNGAQTNNDGHGYAIICNGELIVGKSMDFEIVAAEFEALRSQYPDGPAMFHSRWGTCGAYSLDNVHPFEVGKGDMTVVAHNGVLSADAQPSKGDRRSDTKILAQSIMPQRFSHLDSPKTRRKLEAWLGTNNKLVVLTVDPRYQASAYIFNESSGHWTEEGIWYSNHGYLPTLTKYSGTGFGYSDYYGGWDRGEGKVWRKINGVWQELSRLEAADLDAERDEAEYEAWWISRYPNIAKATGRINAKSTHVEGYDGLTGTLFSDGVTRSIESLTDAIDRYGDVMREITAKAHVMKCPTCDSDQVDNDLRICKWCECCLDCNTHITECLCDPCERCELMLTDCKCDDGATGTGWPTVIGTPPAMVDTTDARLCETVSCPGFQLARRCDGCIGCKAECFCEQPTGGEA